MLMLFGISGLDARPRHSQTQETTAPGQRENELVIETDSELPDTYPQADYEFRFRARGGVPALHWRLLATCPLSALSTFRRGGFRHASARPTG